MTVNIPTPSLGPSWLPKIGGFLAVIGAALEVVPDSAPGASYAKPWGPFIIAVGAGLIGFTTRQNNKTSEQVGLAPQPNPQAVPAPNPTKP